jgi:cytochrome c biogenesis protein CcdA
MENKIMKQLTTFFGALMVFFYLGVGGYLIFTPQMNYIDKPLRVILGSTLILYGIYRAFRAYSQIVELFSGNDKNDSDL